MRFAGKAGWRAEAFAWAWRLAILVLPWQTRYFVEGPPVAGWPWEQGRLSFYVSWIPLLLTVALGHFLPERTLPKKIVGLFVWPLVVVGMVSILATPTFPAATIQWWLQVALLAMFVVTLLRAGTEKEKMVFWFVASLLPCAAVALVQVWTQNVWGWSWLGMATQNPSTLGVAVVQTDTLRWLRAYGVFPHPNVLGVWMAVGSVAAVWLATQVKNRTWLRIFYLPSTALIVATLFYSFSRAAWIAAAVGLAVLVLSIRRDADIRLKGNAFFLVLVLFASLTFINRDLVWSRAAATSRVETRSVITRTQSLRDGLRVFAAYPFFGTGTGNYLPALAAVKNIGQSDAPLEPPHQVWLLALAEVGTFGFAAIAWFVGSTVWLMRKARRHADRDAWFLGLSVASVWLVALMFDHYAWSLWSGQTLTALVITLVMNNMFVGDGHEVGEHEKIAVPTLTDSV